MTRPSGALTVGDVMALDPIVVQADAPLADAIALLEHHHVHGLPVVDRAGSLVGVLSQTDLLRARSTEFLWSHWPGLAVRHLMTSPALTVSRGSLLSDAARRMERHHVHRLVVVADADPHLPIGILSTTDLIRALADETAPATPAATPGAPDAHV